MTYKELYLKEHPECKDIDYIVKYKCPNTQLDGIRPPICVTGVPSNACPVCWDREIPEKDLYVHNTIVSGEKETYEIKTAPNNSEEAFAIQKKLYEAIGVAGETAKKASENLAKTTSSILDSGTRREFSTGAVRDIQEGKGRCDLMPLDVVAEYMEVDPNERDWVLWNIEQYQRSGSPDMLYIALSHLGKKRDWDGYTMTLEVAKHFEAGAKKYGEYNWQKGIPTHCYIDSAVRHYLKFLRGDKDEPHDRAFVWNILCCIWTCKHKPELNDYPRKEAKKNDSAQPLSRSDD